jgi:hypothetical protein
MFNHSTGGGTGSGLTMQVQEKIQDLLLSKNGCTFNFSVFPSQNSNSSFFL